MEVVAAFFFDLRGELAADDRLSEPGDRLDRCDAE
jgi:hypothetical protein